MKRNKRKNLEFSLIVLGTAFAALLFSFKGNDEPTESSKKILCVRLVSEPLHTFISHTHNEMYSYLEWNYMVYGF